MKHSKVKADGSRRASNQLKNALSFISSLQNRNSDNRLSYSNCTIRMNVALWKITWPVKIYFYVNRRGPLNLMLKILCYRKYLPFSKHFKRIADVRLSRNSKYLSSHQGRIRDPEQVTDFFKMHFVPDKLCDWCHILMDLLSSVHKDKCNLSTLLLLPH